MRLFVETLEVSSVNNTYRTQKQIMYPRQYRCKISKLKEIKSVLHDEFIIFIT